MFGMGVHNVCWCSQCVLVWSLHQSVWSLWSVRLDACTLFVRANLHPPHVPSCRLVHQHPPPVFQHLSNVLTHMRRPTSH